MSIQSDLETNFRLKLAELINYNSLENGIQNAV